MIEQHFLDGLKEVSIDTGIYIKYFEKEEGEFKKILRESIFDETSRVNIYGHYLLKSEIYYILCRSLGMQQAEEKVQEIEKFITFINGLFLYKIAGQIKCEFPLALPDCYSIAIGYIHSCPVLFLKEKELAPNIIARITEKYQIRIQTL